MSRMTLVHTVKLKQFGKRIPLFAVGPELITRLYLGYVYLLVLLTFLGGSTVATDAGNSTATAVTVTTVRSTSRWLYDLCPNSTNSSLANITGDTLSFRRRKPFLSFCTSHSLLSSFNNECRDLFQGNVSLNSSHCACLNSVITQEREAEMWSRNFGEVLDRVDCRPKPNPYAGQWTCPDCMGSYKRWACAMNLPRFDVEGNKVLPCNSVCTDVLQKCMVIEPLDAYGAIPIFDCPGLHVTEGEETGCFLPAESGPTSWR